MIDAYLAKRKKEVQPVMTKAMQAVLKITLKDMWTGNIRNAKDQYFADALGEDWFKEIGYLLDEQPFIDLTQQVKYARAHNIVYPESKDVLNAFKLCRYDNTKVVVIGQDPYHDGNADGLAFSCKLHESPSWKVIETELNHDIQFGRYLGCYGKLDHWAEQGVLLLNSSLTVDKDRPGSHSSFLWYWFVNRVCNELMVSKKHLVFIILGARAKEAIDYNIQRQDIRDKHYFIYASHPMVEVYNKNNPSFDNRFFGSKPFSRTNSSLIQNNLTPIEW